MFQSDDFRFAVIQAVGNFFVADPSLSSLLQMDTANTHAASANVRLRWNYHPDSDLYIICTAGSRFANLAAANPLQFDEHRFALKYTYSFSPGGKHIGGRI